MSKKSFIVMGKLALGLALVGLVYLMGFLVISLAMGLGDEIKRRFRQGFVTIYRGNRINTEEDKEDPTHRAA